MRAWSAERIEGIEKRRESLLAGDVKAMTPDDERAIIEHDRLMDLWQSDNS